MQPIVSEASCCPCAISLLPKSRLLWITLNFEHPFPASKGAVSRHIHPVQALVMHAGRGRIPAKIEGNEGFTGDARVLVGGPSNESISALLMPSRILASGLLVGIVGCVCPSGVGTGSAAWHILHPTGVY